MGDTVRIGVIMNGVTGRMGTAQHLERSIMAIRAEGGVRLRDGRSVVPEPVLVGRNPDKLRALATANGLERWTTDLDACLGDPALTVYFDAQTTDRRAEAVGRAIAAGKHVYCEKPVATDLDSSLALARAARDAGVANGVVQDKLFLPGLRKLRRLIDSGFFDRILDVRLDFGYWVFEGHVEPSQRPSWNYRAEAGGGIVLDMYCHWRYVLDGLFGEVRGVVCRGATHIPERVGEDGVPYRATADDAAYGILELEGGVLVHAASSWCTRVRRDDLLTIHVDGTGGSAVAGLRECWAQPRAATPRPTWNPDVPSEIDYRAGWLAVPEAEAYGNAFKVQWELFLRHVAAGEPFRWDLLEGAKGVQLAEAALRSWREARWVDVPGLAL
jgi:predicted dehydrogenase